MSPDHPLGADVSALLDTAVGGDANGVDRLVPLIYDELRAVAHRQLEREHGPQTLQTTALVHEAYLRLAGDGDVAGRGRAYFFAAAARAMRFASDARKHRERARGFESRSRLQPQVHQEPLVPGVVP